MIKYAEKGLGADCSHTYIYIYIYIYIQTPDQPRSRHHIIHIHVFDPNFLNLLSEFDENSKVNRF